jgi:hypothetical protein
MPTTVLDVEVKLRNKNESAPFKNAVSWAGSMDQAVEHLPCKYKALSLKH